MDFDEVIQAILNHVYGRLSNKLQENKFDKRILSNQVDVLISTCRGGVPTGAPGAKGLINFKLTEHRDQFYVDVGGEKPQASEDVSYKKHLVSLKFSIWFDRPHTEEEYAGLIIY